MEFSFEHGEDGALYMIVQEGNQVTKVVVPLPPPAPAGLTRSEVRVMIAGAMYEHTQKQSHETGGLA